MMDCDTVVKLGGALLADADAFDAVLTAIGGSQERRFLIVPGGGPFADAVREVDRRIPICDDAAHWMAILAMDQYAHLIAARLTGSMSMLVTDPQEVAPALADGRIPVLAPFRWLSAVDPLPHSWTVTSDSIAAWVAGAVGARRLVLVKPAKANGAELVDAYFSRALPSHVAQVVVAADQLGALQSALRGSITDA
jgi:aspartokinase-like uncharacterized kinase